MHWRLRIPSALTSRKVHLKGCVHGLKDGPIGVPAFHMSREPGVQYCIDCDSPSPPKVTLCPLPSKVRGSLGPRNKSKEQVQRTSPKIKSKEQVLGTKIHFSDHVYLHYPGKLATPLSAIYIYPITPSKAFRFFLLHHHSPPVQQDTNYIQTCLRKNDHGCFTV